MGTRSKKTTRISVSLEAEDHRDLNLIAEKSDVSVAWVIRRAIAEFLDKHRGLAFGQLPLALEERKADR